MTICAVMATAADARQVKCTAHCDWFDRRQQQELGLPKPVTDLLKRLHDGEFE
jgi:hypothetical protein